MIYYKHKETGEVFAYETEQEREEWGCEHLVPMTDEEVFSHLNPPPPPPTIPEQVTRAQGKAILIQEGYWEDVETYLEAIEDSKERALATVALNDTIHWRRDSHTLLMMAEALDISEEELDELFIKAEKIAL